MAKNDAIVVLHSALDYRRVIDVPGYERIKLHPATRFIGTMNYEYAGTKELNEALVSRFLVIDIPAVDEEKLKMILKREFPTVDEEKLLQFIGIFMDLQLKAENGDIYKSYRFKRNDRCIKNYKKRSKTNSCNQYGYHRENI